MGAFYHINCKQYSQLKGLQKFQTTGDLQPDTIEEDSQHAEEDSLPYVQNTGSDETFVIIDEEEDED